MSKYFLYMAAALIAVILIYFGFFGSDKAQQNNKQQTEQPVNARQWETKTDEQLPVTVKVTPREFGKDVKEWKFDVTFDTHSGSLDEDPLKTVSLFDGKGNIYQPISWEGAGPGGHHREGVLSFNSIIPIPAYVELKVKDVGSIPERSFKWHIE